MYASYQWQGDLLDSFMDIQADELYDSALWEKMNADVTTQPQKTVSHDTIVRDFFIHNEKFTVEDYDTDKYALYHEEMFVSEIHDPNDKNEAYQAALNYLFQIEC